MKREWAQILLVVVAYRFTAIPPWSFVTYSGASEPAFAITEWSWLPDGVMPTSNFCLSTWVLTTSLPDALFVLQSGSDILKLTWAGSTLQVLLNGSSMVSATVSFVDYRWFFMVINVYSGMTYLLIAMRKAQAFVTAQESGTFELTSTSIVRGAISSGADVRFR